MSINLSTLKCGECGGGVLLRTGLNQYTCQHCGSVSVVEDDVSDRLDRVLHQVKNAAAEMLVAEQAERGRQMRRVLVPLFLGFVAITLAITVLSVLLGAGRTPPPRLHAASRPVEPPIPADLLKLEGAREVLVPDSVYENRLLVDMRNETGRLLEMPSLEALFFDGDNRVGSSRASSPLDVLGPGESVTLLIDMPSRKTVTRHEFVVGKLRAAKAVAEEPGMVLPHVRLVQQGKKVELVGRLTNSHKQESLSGGAVLVRLFDAAGAVIGMGTGYAQASDIAPGSSSPVHVRLVRFSPLAEFAAWDYRVDYSLVRPKKPERGNGNEDGGKEAEGKEDSAIANASASVETERVPAFASNRVVRSTSAPEQFNPAFTLGTEDLLADESALFDPAQLELLPLQSARSITHDPVFLTKLVNRSQDTIVLAPGAVISSFNGSRLDNTTAVSGLQELYPGERYPILLDPRNGDAITQTRIEYKPMRRAALPGPRVKLDVAVDSTRAYMSSMTVNFSRRYQYKAVEVKGHLTNPGKSIVRKPRLWVMLRDKAGALSGFTRMDHLPSIAPGESVPFQTRVEQLGKNFATVDTFYQSGP